MKEQRKHLYDDNGIQGHHQLVELMQDWLAKEHKRYQDIHKLVERLIAYEGKAIENSARNDIRQVLAEYRGLLTGK